MNIQFERECYKCEGDSRYSGTNCERCLNTGKVATKLGDELMEFLKNQQVRDGAKGSDNGQQ
jgi:reverse gyrase